MSGASMSLEDPSLGPCTELSQAGAPVWAGSGHLQGSGLDVAYPISACYDCYPLISYAVCWVSQVAQLMVNWCFLFMQDKNNDKHNCGRCGNKCPDGSKC